jgi:hypothetical protein
MVYSVFYVFNLMVIFIDKERYTIKKEERPVEKSTASQWKNICKQVGELDNCYCKNKLC